MSRFWSLWVFFTIEPAKYHSENIYYKFCSVALPFGIILAMSYNLSSVNLPQYWTFFSLLFFLGGPNKDNATSDILRSPICNGLSVLDGLPGGDNRQSLVEKHRGVYVLEYRDKGCTYYRQHFRLTGKSAITALIRCMCRLISPADLATFAFLCCFAG